MPTSAGSMYANNPIHHSCKVVGDPLPPSTALAAGRPPTETGWLVRNVTCSSFHFTDRAEHCTRTSRVVDRRQNSPLCLDTCLFVVRMARTFKVTYTATQRARECVLLVRCMRGGCEPLESTGQLNPRGSGIPKGKQPRGQNHIAGSNQPPIATLTNRHECTWCLRWTRRAPTLSLTLLHAVLLLMLEMPCVCWFFGCFNFVLKISRIFVFWSQEDGVPCSASGKRWSLTFPVSDRPMVIPLDAAPGPHPGCTQLVSLRPARETSPFVCCTSNNSSKILYIVLLACTANSPNP